MIGSAGRVTCNGGPSYLDPQEVRSSHLWPTTGHGLCYKRSSFQIEHWLSYWDEEDEEGREGARASHPSHPPILFSLSKSPLPVAFLPRPFQVAPGHSSLSAASRPEHTVSTGTHLCSEEPRLPGFHHREHSLPVQLLGEHMSPFFFLSGSVA